MPSLSGAVCLVTGASRGIGRGIALQLGEAGATVYITGRTLNPKPNDAVGGSLSETAAEIDRRGGVGRPVVCDHSKDDDIVALFDQIKREQDGQLDVLVNNAFTAVSRLTEEDGKNFWEQDLDIWDAVNHVGLRSHYIASVLAARMMTERRSGLIVNVSSYGGLQYVFNVAYGVGKEAKDRMAVDMAWELRKQDVACVSLWPGYVRTEQIMTSFGLTEEDVKGVPGREYNFTVNMFRKGETTEYVGKAVVALASDPNVMKKSGKVLMTGDLGREYGFRDIDGSVISTLRSVSFLLDHAGYSWLAKLIPAWVRLPCWLVSFGGHKL